MIKLMFLISKLDNILLHIIIICSSIIFQVAHAQKFNYRKDKIENSINTLQHVSNAHSECLIQMQQQLSKNQQNINILRGYIQELQHHLLKIENDQKKSYKKMNEILNHYNKIYIDKNNHDQSSTMSQLKIIPTAKKNINTLNVNHDLSYKQAVSLVLEKKQYNQAIQAFQNFIKNYPDSHYQANAHYWLGQLFYNQNNKKKASYYFALVTKNYPTSLKAPDALLKIGVIMQETNQKEKAKVIYRQIGKLYPASSAAKQAQKRLQYL